MIWIGQFLFFCAIMYVACRPQALLSVFFQVCKCAYYIFCTLQSVKMFITTAYYKLKRYYLLKTRKFENRPVMQPPTPIVKNLKPFTLSVSKTK